VETWDDTAARDPLLAAFVAARSDEAARPILADVLSRAAVPRLREVVRGQAIAGEPAAAAELEELEHAALLRLTQEVWRQRGGDEPIPFLDDRATRAEPRASRPTTSRAVSTSVPNFAACRRARSVSWAPDTPSGNPR